jgi:hypothetical protein
VSSTFSDFAPEPTVPNDEDYTRVPEAAGQGCAVYQLKLSRLSLADRGQ